MEYNLQTINILLEKHIFVKDREENAVVTNHNFTFLSFGVIYLYNTNLCKLRTIIMTDNMIIEVKYGALEPLFYLAVFLIISLKLLRKVVYRLNVNILLLNNVIDHKA
jgi:hypothetical protein